MKRWMLFFLLSLIGLVWLLAGPANEAQAMAEPDPITPKALNAANVAEFVDNYVSSNLAPMQVPGTAIVVVQGDEILHAVGYGLADLAANQPVVVDETVFRFGSVSKLFTRRRCAAGWPNRARYSWMPRPTIICTRCRFRIMAGRR